MKNILFKLWIILSKIAKSITVVFKSIKWKEIWTTKKFTCRDFFKSTIICFSNVVIAALIGLLLLMAVFKLPVGNIVNNVEESAHILDKEGTYPSVFSWCTSQLDNFTDAIMLAEAADATNDTYVNKALMAYRGIIEDKNPQETLVSHYIAGEKYTGTTVYARYWHGYHIILKPLLEFTNYGTIRIINGIAQIILLLIVCLLLFKRDLKHFIIPYIITFLLLMPIVLAMSLQFSSCYYGISFGVIFLLILPDKCKDKYAWIIFLNIGIFTAYFDFLTYPIATFGVPAVLFVALSMKDTVERKLRSMIENGIAWCFGFGGMWFSKLVITATLTDFNIFEDAFGAFSIRVSDTTLDGVTKYSIFKCSAYNYLALFKTPVTIIIVCFVALLMILIYKKGKTIKLPKILIPYIVLAFVPIVWFSFATNHSVFHCFFTNKCCIVSVLAMLFGLTEYTTRVYKKSAEELEN